MNCDILKILDKENLYLLGLPRASKFIKTSFKKQGHPPSWVLTAQEVIFLSIDQSPQAQRLGNQEPSI